LGIEQAVIVVTCFQVVPCNERRTSHLWPIDANYVTTQRHVW